MVNKKVLKKVALIFLIAIIAISGWILSKSIQSDDTLDSVYYGTTEADKIKISTEIGGRIKEINMKEGDEVKAGDLVATIDSRESSLNVQSSEISIKNAENSLEKVKEGSRIEEIKSQKALVNQAQALVKQGEAAFKTAQNNVSNAEANYNFKKKKYDDTVSLYESGAETKYNTDAIKNDLDNTYSVLDNAKTSLKSAEAQQDNYKAQLDAVTQKLNLLVNGSSERDKAAAEYNLEQSKNNYDVSKSKLDKGNIISFSNGIIESVNFNIGEYLTPGSSIAILSDNKNLWVKIYVPESMLPKIELNEEVELKNDFLKDKVVKGEIIYVSKEAEFTPMNVVTKKDRMKLVYEVKIKILDNLDVIKSGMLFSVDFE